MYAKDFQIINGGLRHPLECENKVLIELTHVSSYGLKYKVFTTYTAYKKRGSDLIVCGKINEITGINGNSFTGEVDGNNISCDFLAASEIFTIIEKIKQNTIE